MINIKELEKRWYKYKAKSLTQFLSILAMVILLPYFLYYIYSNRDILMGTPQKEIIQPVAPKIEKKVEKKDLNSTTVETTSKVIIKEKPAKTEELLLSPTIPILDIEEERSEPTKKVHKKATHHTSKKLIPAKQSGALTAKELAVIAGKDLSHEHKKINFTRSSANYKEVMEEKFRVNKHPREALLLAKAYYKEGDYKQAEDWALKANQLDGSLDESWLLFAKSKVKLGKKQEALKILVAYYKKSRSSKAKGLIEKIKEGSV